MSKDSIVSFRIITYQLGDTLKRFDYYFAVPSFLWFEDYFKEYLISTRVGEIFSSLSTSDTM